MDDQTILAAIEAAASPHGETSRIAMFGGTAVLLGGNMVAALSPRGLLLRVGRDQHAAALARPGTRPMEMRGRTMEGYLYVDPAALEEAALEQWIAMTVGHVAGLPAKAARKARGPKKAEGV
jgi:TfoX/Sxy family transcriptional regulator of competence genes